MAGGVAGVMVVLACNAVLAAHHPADVCLEVTPETLTADEWQAVTALIGETLTERAALFPLPSLTLETSRLDIDSGHLTQTPGHAPCLEPGFEWTARFGRDFLEAGADRMLAEAPTTPGIGSDVTIEWYPSEARMRTTLTFAGPLDIPNGTCWVDDALTVDPLKGGVVASGEQGVRTSPFAEGACGRFFGYLPDGGAGEQAVTLLPQAVTLADGGELRFVAEDVVVADDAVSVSGYLERD
jgi:hypothetical protein